MRRGCSCMKGVGMHKFGNMGLFEIVTERIDFNECGRPSFSMMFSSMWRPQVLAWWEVTISTNGKSQ